MSRPPDGEEAKVKKSYRAEVRVIKALIAVYGSFSEGLNIAVANDKKIQRYLKGLK